MQLVCPRDRQALIRHADTLRCAAGHSYPIADGIPILLTEAESTHWGFSSRVPEDVAKDLAEDCEIRSGQHTIDPYVNKAVVWSSGNLYRDMLGGLQRYPIPEIRLAPGNGRTLLDVGCLWGRWSIAAAQKGYRVIGIDPTLPGVLAARRVARQLGVAADFIVGDARHLPFADHSFDTVFSYSVLQHMAPHDAWESLSEVGRVLKSGGTSLIQMANSLGIRSVYHQAKRGFGDPGFFGVRYYTPGHMRRQMEQRIGPTKLTVDGYFGLGIQASDKDLMPVFGRAVISASEFLRHSSEKFPPLKSLADSLYFESQP